MKRFLIFLPVLFFGVLNAQNQNDTIPKLRKLHFGIEQRNIYDTDFTKDYQWENSISFFVKRNEYSFSIGASMLSNIEDYNIPANKVIMPGGCLGAGIELYNYKKILYATISFSYAHYRYRYIYGKGSKALMTSNSAIARVGIEFSPQQLQQLHCFANFGRNLKGGMYSYTEPNGEVHSLTYGGAVWVVDFGLKYFFSKK